MSNQETSDDVEKIMENIRDIAEKKQLLLENENMTFHEYIEKKEKEIEIRKQSIEEWMRKELDFAEKYMKSQVESINTDYEREIADSNVAILKYINYKYRILVDSFKQFHEHIDKFDSPFLKVMREEYNNSKKVVIEKQTKPEKTLDYYARIISGMPKAISESESIMTYKNEEYDLQSQIAVKIADNLVIHGKVDSFTSKRLKVVSEGKSLVIPFKSVNIEQVEITKE